MGLKPLAAFVKTGFGIKLGSSRSMVRAVHSITLMLGPPGVMIALKNPSISTGYGHTALRFFLSCHEALISEFQEDNKPDLASGGTGM